MRSQWLLLPLLNGLLSTVGSVATAHDGVAIRQQETDSESSAAESSTAGSDESTSSPPEESETSAPPPSSTTGGGGNDDEDVTVTVTRTVSGEGDTATETRTVTTNIVTTILVTTTIFETSTVTNNDEATATSTIWQTSTVVVSGAAAKRGFEIPVRTLPLQDVEANPTVDGEVPAVTDIKELYMEMARRRPEPAAGLEKRATITETVTTTVGGDSENTVTTTVTKTVQSTTSSVTTATEVDTTTEAANAVTTVTVTSTRTVTSTSVNTDTSTNTPGGDDSGDNNGGGGSERDGLSTGAIAGIAVGAGVGGLAVLGALFWFCWRKRRSGDKYEPDDTLGGGSEVPVGFGGAGGGGSMHGRNPSMTQNTSSAGDTIGHSPMREPALPKLASPEGYRGTATGRSGYTKPEPYGAAYLSASNTVSSPTNSRYSPTNRSSTLAGDHLPEHPLASEMDGGRAAPGAQAVHAAELGNEGGSARWANPGAAEADSQPARPARGGPVYEMG